MEQEHLLDQITSEEIKKPMRPVVITVICIIYFCFVAILIPAFIINSRGSSNWAAFIIIIAYMAIIITFIIAIWKMKKWGAYGFIGFSILSEIAIILMGNWSLRDFLIPLIFSIILLFQIKKME
jgi:F0F1-type ATP synthase membrane subunit a